LKSSAAKLLREVVGVDHAREAPSHVFLLIAPLPAAAPTFDAAQAVKDIDIAKPRSKAALRQCKLDNVRKVALIHSRGGFAFAARHFVARAKGARGSLTGSAPVSIKPIITIAQMNIATAAKRPVRVRIRLLIWPSF
jgi:hypothetical protein